MVARPGGFALHEAFQRRVAGVSNLHVVQFPLPPMSRSLKQAATPQHPERALPTRIPTPPGPTLVACTIPPCLPRSIAS